MEVYAAYHKNPQELEKSSSGAVFVALSDIVLKSNGIIFSSSYDYKTHKLSHKVCRTPEERDACRGSKYIQSYISKNLYKEVEEALNRGTPVLYMGTPCQIAAVKKYAEMRRIKTDSLYTCDIICHGVGNPKIWDKFIQSVERENAQIYYLTFKDKQKGWENPRCIAKTQNKEISLRGYSWLYFSDSIMRPVCYECKFAKSERIGDVTIGDFWKVKVKTPDMYNPRGTSFIMVNTEKGKNLFDSIKESLNYKKVNIDDVLQNNMQQPTEKSAYRANVMRDFAKMNSTMFFKKWEIKLLMDKLLHKIHH